MRIERFTNLYRDVTKEGTKIPQEKYCLTGQFPIVDQGQRVIAGWWNDDAGIFKNVPAIIFGDHTRAIKYMEQPFFIGADGVKILRPTNIKDNPKYLYYALQAAKIPNLGYSRHFKVVKELQICIYSRDEQNEIVRVLEKIDNLIEQRHAETTYLDQLVKSRFIELFGDQTANPYAWQQTSIGACCTLKSGTSLPADRENEGGAIPYVKVGDMNYPGNEQYITTSSRFVSEQTAGTGVFPVGTVVFPKRGGAIGTNKKRLTRIPICADLNVMGVTAGRRLTPQYLMAYFNTVDLGTLNNGSSVPQINNKDIAPLLICIPPMALQEQFAAFVEQTDKSKYYSSLSFRYCQAAANTYRQEWMTCRTSDF